MTEDKQTLRTKLQNKALHKLFDMWANALNDAGKDMLTVLKPEVEIPWTKSSVEQYIWLPLEKEIPDLRGIYDKMTSLLENYIEVEQLPSIEDIFQVNLKKGLRIYFGLVADALNDAGRDMRVVLPSSEEVWWTKDTVKDFLWRPVQKLQLGKKSTTTLLTKDIDKVYEVVNRHLGKHIETVMFPKKVDDVIRQQQYEQSKQIQRNRNL